MVPPHAVPGPCSPRPPCCSLRLPPPRSSLRYAWCAQSRAPVQILGCALPGRGFEARPTASRSPPPLLRLWPPPSSFPRLAEPVAANRRVRRCAMCDLCDLYVRTDCWPEWGLPAVVCRKGRSGVAHHPRSVPQAPPSLVAFGRLYSVGWCRAFLFFILFFQSSTTGLREAAHEEEQQQGGCSAEEAGGAAGLGWP